MPGRGRWHGMDTQTDRSGGSHDTGYRGRARASGAPDSAEATIVKSGQVQNSTSDGGLRVASRSLLVGAAAVLLIGGMRVAAPVLVPVLLAAFIAIAAIPALLWLTRQGVPRTAGLLIIVALICALLAAFVLVVTSAVEELTVALPTYQQRFEALQTSVLSTLDRLGVELPEQTQPEASSLFSIVATSASSLAGVVSNLFLIVLIVVFILAEASGFGDKLRVAIGRPSADLGRYTTIVAEVQKYLLVKTLTSAATGGILFVWMALLELDFTVLWATTAFVFNFIPTLGSIIASIPPISIALLQHGPASAVAVAVGFLAVNMIIGNILEPRVMGRTLGMSPLVVLLSMIFWGWVLGTVGALLAVPLTMILKITMENSDEFRWLAVLLGPAVKKTDIPAPASTSQTVSQA